MGRDPGIPGFGILGLESLIGMTWEDAEQSAISREDWRRNVAQCVYSTTCDDLGLSLSHLTAGCLERPGFGAHIE